LNNKTTTISRTLHGKHKLGRKARAINNEQEVLIKSPSMQKGTLKTLFYGKTSKGIMNEIRREEFRYDSKLGRRLKVSMSRAKRTFHVSIDRDEAGFYFGRCKELPNAFTQAKTLGELKERMSEVIDLILEGETN